MSAIFGPSGCGFEGEERKITAANIGDFIKEKGLDAFEYSFGHGFMMSVATAEKAGENFKKNDIAVSLHAPFYINFANPDEIMAQKSLGYILTGLKFCHAFGASKYVFHAASCGQLQRADAIELVKKRFDVMLETLHDKDLLGGTLLCPETMGKSMQIGTFEEIIDLCQMDKCLIPTFDFGHINSLLQGGMKTCDDYKRVLDLCIEKLGYERTNNCHIHFSKIQYGPKGEIKHLDYLEDNVFGPDFEPLARVLVDYKLSPTVITESANQMVRDSQILKEIYLNVKNKAEKSQNH